MDDFLQHALSTADQFIRQHPDYAPHDEPLISQGVTNRVVCARYQGQTVYLKFFGRLERYQRELYGLQHFAPTGLVPRVIDGSHENMIVLSEIPGAGLAASSPGTEPANLDMARASRSLGHAAAQLVLTPLSAQLADAFERRFYEGETLQGYLTSIVNAAHILSGACRMYQAPVFRDSLALVAGHVDTLLSQPRILYHQDAGNVAFVGDQVSGFFDLEMCRVGTLSMQLGSLFLLFYWCPLRWKDFLHGFQDAIARRLDPSEIAAGLAFAHFMVWRSITRFGEWDGQFVSAEEAEQEWQTALNFAGSLGYYNAIVKEEGL